MSSSRSYRWSRYHDTPHSDPPQRSTRSRSRSLHSVTHTQQNKLHSTLPRINLTVIKGAKIDLRHYAVIWGVSISHHFLLEGQDLFIHTSLCKNHKSSTGHRPASPRLMCLRRVHIWPVMRVKIPVILSIVLCCLIIIVTQCGLYSAAWSAAHTP